MAEGNAPSAVTSQLLEGEHVEYFSYIAQKGGCFSMGPRQEHWIAMTDRRMMYRAMVRDENRTVERDGLIPLSKVSFIEVAQATTSGCMASKSFELKVGSSGSQVVIPIPTREKGIEIRQSYSNISERQKWGQQG